MDADLGELRSALERATKPRALSRSWPSLVAGVIVLALLVDLAWDAGGYFPYDHLGTGAIGCVALGALLLIRPPHWSLSNSSLIALGALALFTVWTGLSTSWSSTPLVATADMQRSFVYVGLFGLALIAAGSGRLARQLVWGVGAVLLAVVGAGLISRLYPDLLSDPSLAFAGEYRLSYPLGYWNAYGALAAMGGVLSVGLAADDRSHPILRALAAASAVVMVAALYLSLSRGAWLAGIVGLAALLGLGANRASLLVTGPIVFFAGTAAIGRLAAEPALLDDPLEGFGQLATGATVGPQIIALVLAAGVTQGVLAYIGRGSAELRAQVKRVLVPALAGLAGLLFIGFVAGYTLVGDRTEGPVAGTIQSGKDFVDRQWDEFNSPTTPVERGTERLKTVRGTRSDLYRVAFDGFEASPLRGGGSGSFEVRWMIDRDVNEKVRDAHSLYFETLGELGIVGFALLSAFIASLLSAMARSRLKPGGLARSQTAAVGSACVVWLVHAGVDWDWQMPVVTGSAMVLAATMFPYGRRRRSTAG